MASRVADAFAWGRRLQSDLVLRTARTAYLAIACVCILFFVVGLALALLMQVSTWRISIDKPLPPARAATVESIAMGIIDAKLAPPTNLRFVSRLIDGPLRAGDFVGHFDADTPNGLADFPDDFEVIGGKDAALFEVSSRGRRSALSATAELADLINAARVGLTGAVRRDFVLRVLARDSAGGRSTPADLMVPIVYGPSTLPAAREIVSEIPNVPPELLALAKAIALKADPQRTDVYFETQKAAVRTPGRCGVAMGDPRFLAEYRRAYEHVSERLTPGNVRPFLASMCDAWRDAVQRGSAAAAESQSARAAVMARNFEARARLSLQKAGAKGVRNAALTFVLGAFMSFLAVALLLAFLAIEGHSKALRLAVETLAASKAGGSV